MTPTILVVEDEISIAMLYVELFRDARVLVAATAQEGVQLLQRVHPDLVLLDLGLKGSRGEDVVRSVGIEALPPVIVVSADDEAAVFAHEIGARYLPKPFRRDALLQAVEDCLHDTAA